MNHTPLLLHKAGHALLGGPLRVWVLPLLLGCHTSAATAADPRVQTLSYDPQAVLTVPVRRGELTLVSLAPDETLQQAAAGLGGDCSRPEVPWCIVAQPGSRSVFIKPKRQAHAPNTLTLVTTARTHTLRLEVLGAHDPRPPIYRLQLLPPAPRPGDLSAALPPLKPPTDQGAASTPEALVAERLRQAPQMRNTRYSLAQGRASEDLVPSLVFDDGRFTYLRLSGHRELPSVFEIMPNGQERLVNTRMEGDLLVVDRVARRWVLRAEDAVVAVWNDAFELDTHLPETGTTVPGLVRVIKDPDLGTSPGPTSNAQPAPPASAMTPASEQEPRDE